ncbi:Response regulator receiver domain-containing protein [Loktanella fryxellensis]|uniref:Response regulator receiver domain-containing protein n=1 Tax=Loktanella fryxellensis TaxID=245187 RepID=A0A1H8AZX1_9RHOB|nr:response regulator [Loktanella fryxellensis]SEM75348.1 Response regulator receiver domain-containing protein [Loktanella fryxellensis]
MSQPSAHPDHDQLLHVLIVQSHPELGAVWRNHLARQGAVVTLVTTAERAVAAIEADPFHVIVLDIVLDDGNALTVADMAAFRQPQANLICVTDNSFFSDGSIFAHSATARLMLQRATPPDELAAIVSHYGERSAASVR